MNVVVVDLPERSLQPKKDNGAPIGAEFADPVRRVRVRHQGGPEGLPPHDQLPPLVLLGEEEPKERSEEEGSQVVAKVGSLESAEYGQVFELDRLNAPKKAKRMISEAHYKFTMRWTLPSNW